MQAVLQPFRLLVTVVCFVTVCSASYDYLPAFGHVIQTDLSGDIATIVGQASQRRTAEALVIIERRYRLPEGTLSPSFAYRTDLRPSYESLLRDPRTRFMPLYMQGDSIMFASPGRAYIQGSLSLQNALILFKIRDNGEVLPLGFTKVGRGVPRGHSMKDRKSVV